MPNAVSDTSVLYYLGVSGHLSLLQKQFGTVLISPGVLLELKAAQNQAPAQALAAATAAGWMRVVNPAPAPELEDSIAILGRGEAEAIMLAAQHHATLLMDEAEGRAIAERANVEVTGTAGILLRARETGDLTAVKPVLDKLIANHRFRLSKALYLQVTAGE